MGVAGLSLARSLGRKGIPVIGFHGQAGWTHVTRYASVLTSGNRNDDQRIFDLLGRMAASARTSPVVFPLSDRYARFLSKNREMLQRSFRFVLAAHATIETLINKREFYWFCQREGLPAPVTFFPKGHDDLRTIAKTLRFPAIFKPAESHHWQTPDSSLVRGRKAIKVDRADELFRWYDELVQLSPDLLVQEVIGGPDSNLHYVVSCVSRRGEPFGFFVGRKLRTYPPHFGRGCYVESVREPHLTELARNLINLLQYRGNIGIEFKLDERDKTYKLIEVNARYGLWDGFAAHCGLDVGYAGYCYALDRTIEPVSSYELGKHWLNIGWDLSAAGQYVRNGELSVWEWVKTLLRPHHSPIWATDDPQTALAYTTSQLRRVGKAALRGVRGRLRVTRASVPS